MLVNNYPMTIVGVSAPASPESILRGRPRSACQIQMQPVVLPEREWLKIDDERSRWVQVFARLEPGWKEESADAPIQVLFHQSASTK